MKAYLNMKMIRLMMAKILKMVVATVRPVYVDQLMMTATLIADVQN